MEKEPQKEEDSVIYCCSECSAELSINDKVCPKCGADVSNIAEDGDLEIIATDNQRYRTLLGFGKLFILIGWVIVGLSSIILISGFMQLDRFNMFDQGFILLLVGLSFALYGIIFVAGGESISCFVSIENNTHATLLAQQEILKMMRKSTEPMQKQRKMKN